MFFNKKAPAFKRENTKTGVKFSIDYHKYANQEKYKALLYKEIIASEPCLAIVNTKFMYGEQKLDYGKDRQRLLGQIARLDISYKEVMLEREHDIVVFGMSVKRNNKLLYEDYIIGLSVRAGDIEELMPVLNNYNIHYFIGCDGCNADELPEKYAASFDDAEKLRAELKYNIFDDNFMKNITIFAEREASEAMDSMLKSFNAAWGTV